MPSRRNNTGPELAVDRSVLVVHLTAEERATLDALGKVLRLSPEDSMKRGLNLLAAAGTTIFGRLTVNLSGV